jgi:hypothetical protein
VTRPRFELSDVVARFGPSLVASHPSLTSEQRRVLRAMSICRTAALGGHLELCVACGAERPAYNSCRNRHCPKCQAAARDRWLEARLDDLLPVPYFHVVFTLPAEIARLALQNQRVLYSLLFTATAETLRSIAATPRHLGAEIGFLCVLHTWSQTLTHHPHIHCLVPGGGLSLDGERWISCRLRFFLPVRVLSRRFRYLFLKRLRGAYERGELSFFGALAGLEDPAAFAAYLAPIARREWVVYAKRPFGGPKQVLSYLGRYTHRVAISNPRLEAITDETVTFRYRDSKTGKYTRHMTLGGEEFLRRFLLHVLPKGFQRIRSYGLLSNRRRGPALARCRELLGVRPDAPLAHSRAPPALAEITETTETADALDAIARCRVCQQGRMRRVATIEPSSMTMIARRPPRIPHTVAIDSS